MKKLIGISNPPSGPAVFFNEDVANILGGKRLSLDFHPEGGFIITAGVNGRKYGRTSPGSAFKYRLPFFKHPTPWELFGLTTIEHYMISHNDQGRPALIVPKLPLDLAKPVSRDRKKAKPNRHATLAAAVRVINETIPHLNGLRLILTTHDGVEVELKPGARLRGRVETVEEFQ